MRTFFNSLAESTSSAWRLLSDTTNFLSRVKLLDSYETELRTWREQLSRTGRDPQVYRGVRKDIVALRRLLREQGYDLRLGSKDIALEGFRHDDAMGEGFQRIVIGLADNDVYYVAGSANHVELDQALSSQCRAAARVQALPTALPVVSLEKRRACALRRGHGNRRDVREAESLVRAQP